MASLSELNRQLESRRRFRSERLASIKSQASPSCSPKSLNELLEIGFGLALSLMLEDTALYCTDANEGVIAQAGYHASADWRLLRGSIVDHLQTLKDPLGPVLRSHYLHGESLDVIASRLGVTRGRVSQLHKQALQELRVRLDKSK